MGPNERSEARRRVAERLRRFINFLMARFTTSSDELFRRAEAKHAEEAHPADAEPKARAGM
jgi:hypothetical protein